MSAEEFDFGWIEDDRAPHADPAHGGVDSLEEWLESNYDLWELGLRLASMAQYYRREYAHIPFNKSGWFSPN